MKGTSPSSVLAVLLVISTLGIGGCLSKTGTSGSGGSQGTNLGTTTTYRPKPKAPSGAGGQTVVGRNTNFVGKVVALGAKVNSESGEPEILVHGVNKDGEVLTPADFEDATVTAVSQDGTETELEPGQIAVDAEKGGDKQKNIRISVVTDYSISMGDEDLRTIAKLHVDLFRNMPPAFEAEMIHFSSEVTQHQDWTSDLYKLLAATEMDPRYPRGATALYDAMGTGLKHLIASDKVARVLLLLTDGMENFSKRYTKEKLVSLVKESKTSIVMVGTRSADVEEMKELMGEGGVFFYADDFEGIRAIMKSYVASLGQISSIKVDKSLKDAKEFHVKLDGSGARLELRK